MTVTEPRTAASMQARYHASNLETASELIRLPLKPSGMPWVISMIGKGGAGKSTTAIQLAGVAAHLAHRVLILDVDPQRSASAWRSLRSDQRIAVHSCLPEDVEVMLARARSKAIDLVLIDNAPNWTSASPRIAALADLSIVTVRPAGFDLVVGLDRVKFLSQQRPSARFVVVIGPAPAPRLGQDNPLVRSAREALRQVGGRVWQRQITHRHVVVESVGHGMTLLEAERQGVAAAEYCRLWNAVVTELQRN